MTEDQKYELATLAGEVSRLRLTVLAYEQSNIPSDPLEAEKAFAELTIARTDLMSAEMRLANAQRRIAHANVE